MSFFIQIGQFFEPYSEREDPTQFVFGIDFASITSKYRFWLSVQTSKTQCGSNSWPLGTQQEPKEALFNELRIELYGFIQKYFL